MPRIDNMVALPDEIAKQLANLSEEARVEGVTLSHILESKDPTHKYDAEERANGLDAFGRTMRSLGIKTRSVPGAGIMSDKVEAFGADENTRIAFAEWVERQKARVIQGPAPRNTRAQYDSADQAQGSPVFPINLDPNAYFSQIQAAVPISEVVAKTTPIKGSTYEAFYLTDVTNQKQLARVAEGAPVPGAKMSGSTKSIKVRKFGRKIDATYEVLRRMDIDLLALHIQRMMVQAENDKLSAILAVVVNGDDSGTSNGATSYQLSVLDPSVTSPAGAFSLTLKAYLRFKAKFINPYTVTTMLANEDVVVATQLMSTGTANIPLLALIGDGAPFGSMTPINNELGDAVRYGLTPAAPSGKIVAFDKRFAINRITEIGGDITETARWADKQVQSLIMTTEENYAIIDQLAIKILDTTS